ncbi:hypothetical protein PJP10_30605 [Mycobacterium kansasii]
MASTRYEFEKYSGKNNFELWKVKMISLLTKQGEDGALEERNSTMKDDEWENLDSNALASIRLCLMDEVLYNVLREKIVASLWAKLENIYAKKSSENCLHLKLQCYTFKMAEGGDLEAHISNFNKLVCKLLDMEEVMKDEEHACMLLNSLPASYEAFKDTMCSMNKTLSVDIVISALQGKAMRQLNSDMGTSSEALFIVGRNSGQGTDSSGSRSKSRGKSKGKVKCWNCGKEGHVKRDCENPKSKREESEASCMEANAAMSDECHGDVLSVSSLRRSCDDRKDEWMLDTGASFHMTPHWNWFTSYGECDGGHVFMSNDFTCNVVAAGTVCIRMFDGVERTLTDVRHVPDLKHNLISLGVLEAKDASA